jgi:predicted MFS family arabinose efflux permease
VGAFLQGHAGFQAVAAAAGLVPLLGIPVALLLPRVQGAVHSHASFLGVVRAIWAPGLSLVFASSGFGTIAAFLALQYATQGWLGADLALTAFGVAYIVARLSFAGLPDRLGGVRVAMVCLTVQAAGLLVIAAAPSASVALLGTTVTGLGYSLVFPSLGVEAVRRVLPKDRGMALGAFMACFDLGLGVGGPLAGIVAGGFSLAAAFVVAALAAIVSVALVWFTRTRHPRLADSPSTA